MGNLPRNAESVSISWRHIQVALLKAPTKWRHGMDTRYHDVNKGTLVSAYVNTGIPSDWLQNR